MSPEEKACREPYYWVLKRAVQSHREGRGPLRHYATVRSIFGLNRRGALSSTYVAYVKNWRRIPF